MKLDLTIYPPQEVEQVFAWARLTAELLAIDESMRSLLVHAVEQLANDGALHYPLGKNAVSNGPVAETLRTMLSDVEEIDRDAANAFVSLTVVVLFAGADGPKITGTPLVTAIDTMADDIERSDVAGTTDTGGSTEDDG